MRVTVLTFFAYNVVCYARTITNPWPSILGPQSNNLFILKDGKEIINPRWPSSCPRLEEWADPTSALTQANAKSCPIRNEQIENGTHHWWDDSHEGVMKLVKDRLTRRNATQRQIMKVRKPDQRAYLRSSWKNNPSVDRYYFSTERLTSSSWWPTNYLLLFFLRMRNSEAPFCLLWAEFWMTLRRYFQEVKQKPKGFPKESNFIAVMARTDDAQMKSMYGLPT